MKYGLLLITLCLLTSLAFANRGEKNEYYIDSIMTDNHVLIKASPVKAKEFEKIVPGSTFAIYALERNEVIALATAVKRITEGVVAKVQIENSKYMVREKAMLRLINFRELISDFPGNYNLMRSHDQRGQARYMPLTYLGNWAGESAATVRKKEFLAGPTLLAYGVHDRVQVETTPLQNLVEAYNVGAKVLIVEEEGYSFSFGSNYTYFRYHEERPVDFHLMLDSFGNSKIMSYTKLSFLGQRPHKNNYITVNDYTSAYTAELQNIYGFMLKNWDRILIGPRYNFEDKLLGGHVAYAFIGKHAHVIVGVQSNNFTRVSIGTREYIPVFDFYWRF